MKLFASFGTEYNKLFELTRSFEFEKETVFWDTLHVVHCFLLLWSTNHKARVRMGWLWHKQTDIGR